MTFLLAVVGFLLLITGLVLTVTWIAGTTRPAPPPSPFALWVARMLRGDRLSAARRRTRWLLLLGGVLAGVVTWFVTGWPVGVAIAALAVPGVPWLFAAATAEKHAIARLGALEAWTRRVADYVRNGLGLQAAIIASTRTTTTPLIEAEVRMLTVRLQAGVDPATALRAFADDLDDYNSDEVVAPLILQLADAGEGLHRALTDIAHALSEEIASRATVDSERATARFTIKFLTVATGIIAIVGALNVGTAAVYGTFLGQVILAVLAVLYVTLMLWIRSLSLPERRPRLLSGVAAPASVPAASTALVPAGTSGAGSGAAWSAGAASSAARPGAAREVF
jgi:Type II secretion system (T2SS), protein F